MIAPTKRLDMGQVTGGARAIFTYPLIYTGFQNLKGAQGMKKELIINFVRPSSESRVLAIGCGNPIARFIILRDDAQNVRDAEGYRNLALRTFPNVRGTLRHGGWVPYTHWIMESTA